MLCKKVYSDILPQFGVTSCLARRDILPHFGATSCFALSHPTLTSLRASSLQRRHNTMYSKTQMVKKTAEWQTSREKLSFQSRQIGKGIFAEAELLPAGLLTLLHMDAEFVPALIIAGSKLFFAEWQT